MQITVITLSRNTMVEQFVGVVEGELTPEQKKQLSKDLALEGVEHDMDELMFCVTRVHKNLGDLNIFEDLYNVSTNGYINAAGEEENL